MSGTLPAMTSRLDPGTTRAIGIDVGGSKVAAAVVSRGGKVVDERRIPTPSSHDTGLTRALADLVEALWADHGPVDAVGVGIAGLVEWPEGRVRSATNHNHRGVGLRRLLAGTLDTGPAAGVRVVVDNDANCAAYAETVRPEARDLLFVAIGTGVGSGILLDGEPFRGRTGMAGEIGHVLVQSDGPRCSCGRIGCLEAVASAKALAARVQHLVAQDPKGSLAQFVGRAPLTPKLAIRAALEGDPEVRKIVRGMGRAIATAAETAHALINFDEIVIGGGVAALGDLLLMPVRERLERYSEMSRHLAPPKVRTSLHGASSIVVGAALLGLTTDTRVAEPV